MEGQKKIGYRDIFRQKEYMKMIVAAMINRFGDSIDAIAFTWIVYEITGNAAWSALIYGLNIIPSIIVTPFAGAWVERKRKKPIMVLTDLARAACVAFVATGYLAGFLRPWMLIVNTLIISTVEAFRGPANTALTPMILEKKYYEYGMSLMTTLSSAVQLIGLAMAAAVIAVIGSAGALYVDVTTFVLSALIILFVKVQEKKAERQPEKRKEQAAGKAEESYWSVLASGFQYVGQNKIVIFLIATIIMLNALITPLNSLQAPLADEILRTGAEALSVIGITLTLGMMLGSFVYPMVRKLLKGKILLSLAGLGIGVYYLSMVAGQPLYDSKVFLYLFIAVLTGLMGVMVSLLNSFLSVEFVKQTDEAYLARVNSILSAFSCAASPLVAFIISGIAAFCDTQVIFLATGILALLASFPLLFSRTLDMLDKTPEGEGEEQGSEPAARQEEISYITDGAYD